MVHAFVVTRLDYCNGVLSGITKAQLTKLQSILNAAARLVARLRKFDHISPVLRDDLHWLPVQQRIDFKISVMAYRCMHGTAPDYLTSMFTSLADDHGRRHLRSAAHGDVVIPRTRTKTLGPRSFAVYGPVIWNKLPPLIRDMELSLNCFRREIKTWYFRRAYPRDQARS